MHTTFRKAVEYLKKCFDVKERCVKLLTTKGNFLSTMSIRSELTGIQVKLYCSITNHKKPVRPTSFETYIVCIVRIVDKHFSWVV